MNKFLYYVLTYVKTNVTLSVLMLNGKVSMKKFMKKGASAFFHPVGPCS